MNNYYISGSDTEADPLLIRLNNTYYGPFEDGFVNNGSLKTMLSKIDHFTLEYEVVSTIPQEASAASDCYHWFFKQVFDFSNRGLITLRIETSRSLCTTLTADD